MNINFRLNNLTNICSNRENKEIASGSFLSFLFKIAGIATTYVYILLITRLYGVKSLGIFSICLTLSLLFAMSGKLGLDTAALKYISQYNHTKNIVQISKIYWMAWIRIFFYSTSLAIFIYIIADTIALVLFRKPEILPGVRIIPFVIVPMALASLNQESLRAIKKFGYYSFFLTQSNLLFSIVGLLVLHSFFGRAMVSAPVFALAFGVGMTFFFSQAIWLKNAKVGLPWDNRTVEPEVSSRRLFKVALPLVLANSMNFIMQWTDTLSLSFFCPVWLVGIYTTATKVANLANIPYMVINSIAAPMISGYYGNNHLTKLKILMKKLTVAATVGGVLTGIVIFLLGEQILLLFGQQFTKGVLALDILLLARIGQAFAGPAVAMLQMTGKEHTFKKIMIISATLNIFLNIILVPLYGIEGAAIATMISILLMNIASRFASTKHLHQKLFNEII